MGHTNDIHREIRQRTTQMGNTHIFNSHSRHELNAIIRTEEFEYEVHDMINPASVMDFVDENDGVYVVGTAKTPEDESDVTTVRISGVRWSGRLTKRQIVKFIQRFPSGNYDTITEFDEETEHIELSYSTEY